MCRPMPGTHAFSFTRSVSTTLAASASTVQQVECDIEPLQHELALCSVARSLSCACCRVGWVTRRRDIWRRSARVFNREVSVVKHPGSPIRPRLNCGLPAPQFPSLVALAARIKAFAGVGTRYLLSPQKSVTSLGSTYMADDFLSVVRKGMRSSERLPEREEHIRAHYLQEVAVMASAVAVPPPLALLDHIQGAMVTQAIHAAAKLGIADVLEDGPLTVDEIADRVSANPETTYRLLRLLASYSIFAQNDDGRFELTPMADALRSEAPLSMRRIALLMGHPIHWEDWSHFTESVQTGEPSLPKYRGKSAWEYFMSNPEYGAVFGQGMANLSELETDAVVGAYDYSQFDKIVDVGGGIGVLLARILTEATTSKGVLFAPPPGPDAQRVLESSGVADRCTIENGSLFEGIPAGGDAYILKHIVHDWPEPQAVQILKAVREAISPKGKLLVMEFVLSEGTAPHPGKLVDLWLMLLVGGKERTANEYSELLQKAGFRLTGVTETSSPISIVEAEPV